VDEGVSGSTGYKCPRCSGARLHLDGIQGVAAFQGVIRRAIHALKYEGRTEVAVPLAELMVTKWGEGLFPVEFLVPVPLHPRRLRERGYNQAALIAKQLASRI
jgi:predicted amidophosphoribosyltransferase